jgi:lysophospholipase L1-like esterase
LRSTLAWTFLFSTLALSPTRAEEPTKFEWKNGDRVVLIGDTLIERDQKYGYLETVITAQNPDKTITFRNLGWSGDTVRGLSRARFGPPSEGWDHLKQHVLALKPTVLIVGYGMAESFEGETALPAFRSGLNQLLDAFAPLKPRVVLVSPIPHGDLGPPLPGPAPHNAVLGQYVDAIGKTARDRGASFVDLFNLGYGGKAIAPFPMTDDGIHLSPFGYWLLVKRFEIRLTYQGAHWEVVLDRRRLDSNLDRDRTGLDLGTQITRARSTDEGIAFESLDALLPDSPAPDGTPSPFVPRDRVLKVHGLEPGTYALKVDGKNIVTAPAEQWGKGVALGMVPERDQAEALRKLINAKNLLYFHRWRPQNETYLFGFRKHEQGNNAREIPLFDPLVEAKEREIAKLRNPTKHVYELTRQTEPGK